MTMAVTYGTFGGQIVHEERGGTERVYVPDPLGSTAMLTDVSGNVTDRFEYWPYGEERLQTGSTPTPFRFVGTLGYYRNAAGRLYVRARTYLPVLARWQTVDPLWPEEMAYGYVGDRPVGFNDPSGLWNPACGGAALCAGAALGGVLACASDPRGIGQCLLCWALSNPVLASVIFGACAALIIACIPALAGWLARIGRLIGSGGGIALPVGALAGDGRGTGGNPACGTSCENQLLTCKESGNGGIPPCGRYYEPYCENCFAQCKSSGSWPTAVPCDYWNWRNPSYDPTDWID